MSGSCRSSSLPVHGAVLVLVVLLLLVGTAVTADAAGPATTRVSVSSSGTQSDGHSFSCIVSGDGRYVTFDSTATNLVPGDTNAASDIFVRDTAAGTTTRVSVDSNGTQGDGNSVMRLATSDDGRYVAFYSVATNLVPGDTNSRSDVFVRDR